MSMLLVFGLIAWGSNTENNEILIPIGLFVLLTISILSVGVESCTREQGISSPKLIAPDTTITIKNGNSDTLYHYNYVEPKK